MNKREIEMDNSIKIKKRQGGDRNEGDDEEREDDEVREVGKIGEKDRNHLN